MSVDEFECFEIVLRDDAQATTSCHDGCKQRAGFVPAEGFCIVDMSLLAVEFERMAVCGRCKKGTLRLIEHGRDEAGFRCETPHRVLLRVRTLNRLSIQ